MTQWTKITFSSKKIWDKNSELIDQSEVKRDITCVALHSESTCLPN